MVHCAEIDNNNIVLRVIVVDDKYEANCENWCHDFTGGVWKQTSYNGNMRKNFAGVGFTYDEARDAFIAPQPYNSWTLDEATCKWEAPTLYPNDGQDYKWDEDIKDWEEIQ